MAAQQSTSEIEAKLKGLEKMEEEVEGLKSEQRASCFWHFALNNRIAAMDMKIAATQTELTRLRGQQQNAGELNCLPLCSVNLLRV
jgi:hypothetical protein